jgi:hypothetical protein
MRWAPSLTLLALAALQPTSQPATPEPLVALLDAKESLALRSLVNRRLASPDTGLRQLREITEKNANPKVIAHADDAEVIDVWLPEAKVPGEMFGLMVFIAPGAGGEAPPEGYRAALAERGLAWVSPRGVGNDKTVNWRVWCALRAVQLFAAKYPLDAGRVYVSGMSGGGKSAMLAGLAFPDTVTGTLAMCGPAYDHPVSAENGGVYGSLRTSLDPKLIELRKSRPFYLYTGDGDMNLTPTQCIGAAMKDDGFDRLTIFVAEKHGHSIPRAEELPAALDALDAPAQEEIPALLKHAAQVAKNNRPGLALAAYRQALSRDPAHQQGLKETTELKAAYEVDLAAAESAPDSGKAERLRQLKAKWGDVKFAP